jgi:hypothetical protein
MRPLLYAFAVSLSGVAALSISVAQRFPAAPAPPRQAAVQAERDLPLLGLSWGKLRGWERTGDGWTLVWQPAHGSWLVRAWVPDGPADALWRVDVAPWLPGARLGRDAARLVADGSTAPALPRDQVGRRDWLIGGRRLAGALPVGTALPQATPNPRIAVEGLLAGLLLAGAVSRRLLPAVPSRFLRRTMTVVALLLVPAVPTFVGLAPQTFQPGVRPWVAELAFGTAAVMLLGAVAFAARTFPATSTTPAAAWLVFAASAGALAGRLEPMPLLAAVAALPWRLPLWIAVALLTGWLAGLAGDGLRELLRVPLPVRLLLLAGLGVASVLEAGAWLGLAIAVVMAAATERGRGTAMGVAAMWGWEYGATQTLCEWEGAQRDALALLAIGAVVLAVMHLAMRPKDGPAGAANG